MEASDIHNRHPCFDKKAHFSVPRIHLPVAARCNIQCRFCSGGIADTTGSKRAGAASRVIKTEEAVRLADTFLNNFPHGIVGIAGPGDPLANRETFETFESIRIKHPHAALCLCTNGLDLPTRIPDLHRIRVNAITVSINAIDPDISAEIYAWVQRKGQPMSDKETLRWFCSRQLEGLQRAAKCGMATKVNTVLIPGINDRHLPELAATVRKAGAILMNIVPLIPCLMFASRRPPTFEELNDIRRQCAQIIPQFHLCRQCRADAMGVPGKNDTILWKWIRQASIETGIETPCPHILCSSAA